MNEREEKNWLEKISLTDRFGTPFLLTDLDIVEQKVSEFRYLMPSIGVYYAVKSNSSQRLIKHLIPIIDGFDIASAGEFQLLTELGVSADRMVYSNPVKVPAQIEQTFRAGVRYFAFDSLSEIQKLKNYAPGSIVYIRVKVSDYGSKFPLSGKFGLDPQHVLTYAMAAEKAGLQVKGLAFHVGSQSENMQVWEAALDITGRLMRDMKGAGIEPEFLDIGGGFPAMYEDLAPTIKSAARVINKAIKKHIPDNVRIFAEPGRYISANSSIIGATVIGREARNGVEWLYLDMGVFQGLMEPLEMSGWRYPIITKKSRRGSKKSFVLTGPTCDAFDTIGTGYLLPHGINVGDRIYLAATGAYSVVYGSRFNGFELPTEHYVHTRDGGRRVA